MKEFGTYLKEIVSQMASKIWLAWEVGSGLLGLVIWLLPKAIERWLEQSCFTHLWNEYGGWVGLSFFVFISVFVAPYLVWRTEYCEKMKLNSCVTELESEDTRLAREETKLNIKNGLLDFWERTEHTEVAIPDDLKNKFDELK